MNIISGKLKISQQSGCAQQRERKGDVLKESQGIRARKSLPGIIVATPVTGTLISSQPLCCEILSLPEMIFIMCTSQELAHKSRILVELY